MKNKKTSHLGKTLHYPYKSVTSTQPRNSGSHATDDEESSVLENLLQASEKLSKTLKLLAEQGRIYLQFGIGFGIVILLSGKLLFRIFPYNFPFIHSTMIIGWLNLNTLQIVSYALAYSAGIDLAYMLFTDGPDEAVEPLIVGLASAILFSISTIGETNVDLAWEILLYVVILGSLFLLKEIFINPYEESDQHKDVVIKRSPLRKFMKKLLKRQKP